MSKKKCCYIKLFNFYTLTRVMNAYKIMFIDFLLDATLYHLTKCILCNKNDKMFCSVICAQNVFELHVCILYFILQYFK